MERSFLETAQMLHSRELHAFHIGAVSATLLNSGCHHSHCISAEVRASQRSATGHCIHWPATVKAMELELWIVGLAKHIRPYEIMQSWHQVSWITAHWNTRGTGLKKKDVYRSTDMREGRSLQNRTCLWSFNSCFFLYGSASMIHTQASGFPFCVWMQCDTHV